MSKNRNPFGLALVNGSSSLCGSFLAKWHWGSAPLVPVDSTTSWHPLDTVWNDTKSIFTDGWRIASSPASMSQQSWAVAGIGFAITGILVPLDEDIQREALAVNGTTGDDISNVGNFFGSNVFGTILSATLYFPGLIADVRDVRIAGLNVFKTLLYSATVNGLLKHLLGRHRPDQNDGAFRLEGPWESEDRYQSFSSGHTTVAFAVASSLSAEIDEPWVTVGLYSAATLAGLSRIYKNRHWASDVFFAAFSTTAIGYSVVNRTETNISSDKSGISLSPTIGGVRFCVEFLTINDLFGRF